ncbi:MAG: hypothetical protein H6811_02135 [Phycisphaeraceae bacterium]|nr:hypothetical protein [Phycisphaeraceae bacterium]
MTRRLGLALPLIVLSVVLSGCGVDPLRAWRGSVERYVRDQGNGDLNSLRLASESGDRFDWLGPRAGGIEIFPANRDDVHGVILGRAEMEGSTWQFFLVGVVHYKGMLENMPVGHASLKDVRLLALRPEGGKWTWRTGPADLQALARYVADQGDETVFPQPGDRLELTTGHSARATERRSGASWVISAD